VTGDESLTLRAQVLLWTAQRVSAAVRAVLEAEPIVLVSFRSVAYSELVIAGGAGARPTIPFSGHRIVERCLAMSGSISEVFGCKRPLHQR